MSTPRTWDIGDPEPTDCPWVKTVEITLNHEDESDFIYLFRVAAGVWVSDDDTIQPDRWEWRDVVRRFGPVQEVQP